MRAGWGKLPGPEGDREAERGKIEEGEGGEREGRDGQREGQRNRRRELQQRGTVVTSEPPEEFVSHVNSHGWGPGTSIHQSLEVHL